MRVTSLLSTPPPSVAWTVDQDVVGLVARSRHEGDQVWTQSVRPSAFEVGPAGLQAVRGDEVSPVLRSLAERSGGAKRAALVVPTGWVRSFVFAFDVLPRKNAELVDVVRWRLKKVVPVPPADLRVTLVPLRTHEGQRRLLCTAGLERAWSQIEGAFAGAAVRLGLITPRVFATDAVVTDVGGVRIVIQLETGHLSLLISDEADPLLLRSKLLPVGERAWEVIQRELRLTLAYVREQLELTDELTVIVVAGDEAIGPRIAAWWSGLDGVRVLPPPAAGVDGSESLGAPRMLPLLGVTGGVA
jgi:hypothetical protein